MSNRLLRSWWTAGAHSVKVKRATTVRGSSWATKPSRSAQLPGRTSITARSKRRVSAAKAAFIHYATIPSCGLSRVVVCQALFQGSRKKILGIVRRARRDAMLGLMETPINYFFNERSDPRTLEAFTRRPLAAHLSAYAQVVRARVYRQLGPVTTSHPRVLQPLVAKQGTRCGDDPFVDDRTLRALPT